MFYDRLSGIQLSILNKFSTGNIFIDTGISYFIFMLITSISNIRYDFEDIISYFSKFYNGNQYSELVIEGKQMDFLSRYSERATSSGVFSDSYRALFHYITNNIFQNNNQTIFLTKSNTYINNGCSC